MVFVDFILNCSLILRTGEVKIEICTGYSIAVVSLGAKLNKRNKRTELLMAHPCLSPFKYEDNLLEKKERENINLADLNNLFFSRLSVPIAGRYKVAGRVDILCGSSSLSFKIRQKKGGEAPEHFLTREET